MGPQPGSTCGAGNESFFRMEKACRFDPFSLQQFALEHEFKTVVEI
jgi:hypothetical protein